MNTTTQQQPATDFGEPWNWNDFIGGTTNRDKQVVLWGESTSGIPATKRATACVNACAGMADPATEIQAMREATEEAERALSNALFIHEAITPYAPQDAADKIENQKHCDNIKAALANLKPFIKP